MLRNYRTSPDAEAILALPHARHPRLAKLCQRLASKPQLTLADAIPIIEAAAECGRVSSIDIDMVQPGSQVFVPFAAAPSIPTDTLQDAVIAHLNRINGARK